MKTTNPNIKYLIVVGSDVDCVCATRKEVEEFFDRYVDNMERYSVHEVVNTFKLTASKYQWSVK